jgi:TonB family protein
MKTSHLIGITLAGVLGAFVVGCASEERRGDPERPQPQQQDGPTVTSEQNDAIDALFRRKAPQLQTCWQQEYERSQNRKVEGDITLQMVVSKAGKPMGLRIVKSTIGVPAIDKCVVDEVNSWQFPEGPGDAPYRRTVHLGAAF